MAIKTTDAISERRPQQGGGCLVAFGLIFFLAGLGGFIGTFLLPVLKITAAQNWTATPCTINSSRVATHRGSDSTTYQVEVSYTYQFNGRYYNGDRYSFAPGSSSGYNDKALVVNSLPAGSRANCYVNPNNPAEAVINRGMDDDIWFGLFTLIFVVVGLGIMVFGVKIKRSESTPRGRTEWRPKGAPLGPLVQKNPAAQTTAPLSPFQNLSSTRERFTGISGPGVPATYDSGPVVLKPHTSKIGTFFGVLIFGTFWNSIVGFFVWNMLHETGSFRIFPLLFMIPFMLIGLAIIGGTIYQFLALFGPQLEITASAPHVVLGGSLDINWKMKTGLQTVQRMHLFLEGREEAIYRRGTDTYTDRNTFAVLDITDLQSQDAMMNGSARVQIPLNTMHSFEAGNNKILWFLVAKGEIPIWPDLKEEYPLVVLPHISNSD